MILQIKNGTSEGDFIEEIIPIIHEMRKREETGEFAKTSMNQDDVKNMGNNDCSPFSSSYEAVSEMKLHQYSDSNCSQYQILIDNLLEGIIIIDDDSIIQYCNQTCIHLLGYQFPSELTGLHISTFIMPDSILMFNNDQKQVCLGRGRFFSPYQVKKKDGSLIWIDGLSCLITYNNQTATALFIRDVTRQHTTTIQLEKLEKKYRTIAELSTSGIVTLDPLGKITYINHSFEQMTRRNEKQLINTLFRELLTNDYVYIFQQIMLNARKKNESIEHIELEFIIKKGQKYPIELSIAPVIENNIFSGYICTVQNIKERKKFEEEIKKSERLKTEFMNIAAHELKSPVTPIKGYLELIISDNESTEKIKKWASISLRNSQRLLLLVDDILDVARLDNDSMKFEIRKLDVSDLFTEIVEDMRPIIEQKQITFLQEIAPNLPEILGDHYRLSQVLRNLFTNAIKFTDEGSISLHAFQRENRVVIEVKDTGIGMRRDEADHIFDKFYQTETSDNRKHEGTGLGLFICKEIIKKHNGTIKVHSELGKGSTFSVSLPSL